MKLEVRRHSSSWFDYFTATSWILRTQLPAGTYEIHHVGSTAVEGLPAKPILDVDVCAVADQIDLLSNSMLRAGHLLEGDLGVRGRLAFQMRAPLMETHLYLVDRESQAFRDHIDFRDCLRLQAKVREDYGKLKVSLIQTGLSRIEYQSAKAQFIEQALVQYRGSQTTAQEIGQSI